MTPTKSPAIAFLYGTQRKREEAVKTLGVAGIVRLLAKRDPPGGQDETSDPPDPPEGASLMTTIGTLRAEEARVFDSQAGYHSVNGESFEVVWLDDKAAHSEDEDSGPSLITGWYWVSGQPGCLWDGAPIGPFGTSGRAWIDAERTLAPDDEGEDE